MEEGRITANGVDFAYLSWGSGAGSSGPLALLLHGFPDTAWTWRLLGPALAESGYRAVAPFMRGYAPTVVPADGRYQTGALAADAHALHAAFGGDERAVLIGHDWGASAAYGAAVLAPERWARVVTMAVPPPPVIGAGLFTYDQLRRSWYMFFFQNPLAEMAVAMDDMAFVARLWQDWSPGFDGSEDVARVRAALADDDNLRAALGYYRALFDPTRLDPALANEQIAAAGVPSQPLLYLHGTDDGCIGVALARRFEGAEVIEGAGHFLQLEKPDEVNRRVLEFLGS
jgi:pimeloyl-ACP methyl ester carboxylesterase